MQQTQLQFHHLQMLRNYFGQMSAAEGRKEKTGGRDAKPKIVINGLGVTTYSRASQGAKVTQKCLGQSCGYMRGSLYPHREPVNRNLWASRKCASASAFLKRSS